MTGCDGKVFRLSTSAVFVSFRQFEIHWLLPSLNTVFLQTVLESQRYLLRALLCLECMLSSSHSRVSYFHCALLPAPSFCAACFEALTQHKLLYLESEYMGTLIICKFHLNKKEEKSDLPKDLPTGTRKRSQIFPRSKDTPLAL